MGKKKPRHSKAVTKTPVSKELAGKLCDIVISGEPLFTREEYANNIGKEIALKDGVFVLKPENYRYYMKARVKISGTNKTLYQQIHEARHLARMKKHEKEQENLVLQAQEFLGNLQKLPLGTSTKRRLKKMRVIEGGRKVQTHEEVETIETPIDPRMVSAKQKGSEYVLDRLDPAYKKDAEAGNVNVFVNLADLRKARDEREPTPVPKEDVKVVDHEDKQVQQEA